MATLMCGLDNALLIIWTMPSMHCLAPTKAYTYLTIDNNFIQFDRNDSEQCHGSSIGVELALTLLAVPTEYCEVEILLMLPPVLASPCSYCILCGPSTFTNVRVDAYNRHVVLPVHIRA